MRTFAISDIHGKKDLLKEALDQIDLNKDSLLVFNGDYVDRGEDSLGVIQLIMRRQKAFPDKVKVLMGNHDKMFLDFLFKKDLLSLHNDWNLATIHSFMRGTVIDNHLVFDGYGIYDNRSKQNVTKDVINFILNEYQEEINWLSSLPYEYESDEYIFVHAGVHKDLENWRDTPDMDKIWIRMNRSIPNTCSKPIIVGHTVNTKMGEIVLGVYKNQIEDYPPIYYIDGGACISEKLTVFDSKIKY